MTEDYSNWSKEDLVKEIKKLKKRKKFGLVWESGKELEQVVELCKEKLPVLHENKKQEIFTNKNSQNHILIKGDNYHAVSVLNYTHKSNIDFIYIDPPYNTGARDWKYNNNFVDADDTYRHTKWLSMMSNRLRIAKNILKPEGIICVTIDDYEAPRLWLLMDEIFGEENHLGTVIIRNNPKGRKTNRKVSLIHEYALFYGRSSKSKIQKLNVDVADKTHNYKKDTDGSYYLPVNLRKQGVDSLAKNKQGKLSNRYYPIYYDPKTGKISVTEKLEKEILPIDSNNQKRIWRRGKEAIDSMYAKGDLWCNKTQNGVQVYFKFRGGLEGEPPQSIWSSSKFSASEHGTQILDKILGIREAFPYPKSHYAVMQCIKISTLNKNATILDFFAGSGTTGHAVLELNNEDQGNRKFILCTNNEVDQSTLKELTEKNASKQEIEKEGICDKVCYPRIQKLINGYTSTKKEKVKGFGGNLKYFKTDFVEGEPTDKNKKKLVDQCTEMLCLREDCFDEIKQTKTYSIFKNHEEKYLGIIYDDDGIESLKKQIKSTGKKFNVYVFSLDDSAREEEFEDVKGMVDLNPIPEVILNVYSRIFR